MTFDSRTTELIALGTAVGANCHPCLKYHVAKARELHIGEDEIAAAVEVGRMVRKGAAGNMDKLFNELRAEARGDPKSGPGGCGCDTKAACG